MNETESIRPLSGKGLILFKPHEGGCREQRLAYREDVPRTTIPNQKKLRHYLLAYQNHAHIQGGPH